MNIKSNYKNSPFYVEYNGTTNYKKNTIAYHPKQDFNKDLRAFFKSRFGADAKDGEILEQILSDYYFRYAHKPTYYEKTIVAVIHKNELKKSNPVIMPLFVLDRFCKDNKNDVLIDDEMIDNYDIMQFIAWNNKFEDVSKDLQEKIVKLVFSDGFSVDKFEVFDKLKNADESRFNDFFVVEIPLNNYLDVELNGVYCYQDNDADGGGIESLHVGLAITNENEKDINASHIPLIYVWTLKEDFTVEVCFVSKIAVDELKLLSQKHNVFLFAVLSFFEIADFNEEEKLSNNRQEQAKLEKQLQELKLKEQELMDNINNKKNNLN